MPSILDKDFSDRNNVADTGNLRILCEIVASDDHQKAVLALECIKNALAHWGLIAMTGLSKNLKGKDRVKRFFVDLFITNQVSQVAVSAVETVLMLPEADPVGLRTELGPCMPDQLARPFATKLILAYARLFDAGGGADQKAELLNAIVPRAVPILLNDHLCDLDLLQGDIPFKSLLGQVFRHKNTLLDYLIRSVTTREAVLHAAHSIKTLCALLGTRAPAVTCDGKGILHVSFNNTNFLDLSIADAIFSMTKMNNSVPFVANLLDVLHGEDADMRRICEALRAAAEEKPVLARIACLHEAPPTLVSRVLDKPGNSSLLICLLSERKDNRDSWGFPADPPRIVFCYQALCDLARAVKGHLEPGIRDSIVRLMVGAEAANVSLSPRGVISDISEFFGREYATWLEAAWTLLGIDYRGRWPLPRDLWRLILAFLRPAHASKEHVRINTGWVRPH